MRAGIQKKIPALIVLYKYWIDKTNLDRLGKSDLLN